MHVFIQTMLSAVMQRLKDIQIGTSPERQRSTINLCYQAYPDVRPWQVKKKCSEDNEFTELYYTYLTLLLHPSDGHDGARRDPALVKELCTLSVKGKGKGMKKKMMGFFMVASKTSSDHLAYTRDLPFLLKLSMDAREFDLALDLGKWRVS